MSKEDIFSQEVARRRLDIQGLRDSLPDINAALDQNSELDEAYKTNQQEFKNRLECIYKETRHYTGKWPIVYTNAQTEKYPYIQGDINDKCNPYYRISEIIAGNNEGLAPQFSEPTRTGGVDINRDRNYQNESTVRSAALSALQAYPDNSQEGENATGGSCSGETPSGSGTTEALCIANDGVWTREYGPGTTAPEKLQNALNAWKTPLVELKADLCTSELEDSGGAAATLLQNIIDQIDIILANLPPVPIYPDVTPPPTYQCSNGFYLDQASCELAGHDWFSTLGDAITATINYIQNNMPTDIDPRNAKLIAKSELLEKKHFALIGLRLHQINGSFTKVKQLKSQRKDVNSLIQDHIKSIADINVIRVNDS